MHIPITVYETLTSITQADVMHLTKKVTDAPYIQNIGGTTYLVYTINTGQENQ